jgi:hypothetical protein
MRRDRIGVVGALACVAILAAATSVAAKEEVLRPYVLAAENPGVIADVAAQTR